MFTVRYEKTHMHLVIIVLAVKTENSQRIRTSDRSFIHFYYSLLFLFLSIRFLLWEFISAQDVLNVYVLLTAFDTAELPSSPKGINNTFLFKWLRSTLYIQVYSFQSSKLINFVDTSIVCIKI